VHPYHAPVADFSEILFSCQFRHIILQVGNSLAAEVLFVKETDNCVLRLFVVRHGEAADNRQMRYLGTRDQPLTNRGIEQACQVAGALVQVPVRAIVTSPLSRAADTAARIQKACGAELWQDLRLSEGSFGSWEGLSRAEVMNLGRQDAEMLARWETDPSCAPPGGESIENVQKRVMNLVQELEQRFPGSAVVLVSHVGPIKALLAAALEIPLQATRRLFLDPGTITVVDWSAFPVLRLFNSHAHFGWNSARWME
jgi:ribonuclease H / adenosylcobalamin/alpha-ribazole phosphatase